MNLYKNILVCVTQQKTCERLIKKAASLRQNDSIGLFVIHVAKNDWNFLNNAQEGEALEYLFSISKSVGANLTVLKSDDITGTIADFAKKNEIDLIIMGQSPNDSMENKFVSKLENMIRNVEFYIIP